MGNRRWFGLLFLLWLAGVTWLCLVSFEAVPDPGVEVPYADKIAHFLFYFSGGILGVLALRERFSARLALNTALSIIFTALFLYGGLIELLQGALPTGRSPQWGDLLANTCGLIVALASLKGAFHEVKSLNWRQ